MRNAYPKQQHNIDNIFQLIWYILYDCFNVKTDSLEVRVDSVKVKADFVKVGVGSVKARADSNRLGLISSSGVRFRTYPGFIYVRSDSLTTELQNEFENNL